MYSFWDFAALRLLFSLFILVPVIEMIVLIRVGSVIGAFSTIGLVLLTAMIGITLLRHQGLSTLMRAQAKMQEGTLPAKEMIEGIFLAVGGALLLTPGFITDGIGLCCLLPGIRHVLIAFGLRRFQGANNGMGSHHRHQGGERQHFSAGFPPEKNDQVDRSTTIDGEYTRDNDEPRPPH